MTTISKLIALLTIALLPAVPAMGQDDDKKVTNAQMVAFGATSVLDTYLSPEEYQGAELRYISQTLREFPGRKWVQQIEHHGNLSTIEDRSGDGSMMGGLYTFDLSLLRSIQLHGGRVLLRFGGMPDFNIGVLYNSRNQNNPAQMRLSMQIGPTASATCRFRLFRNDASAAYQLSVPVAGLMFSPNYGQSYYEIFSRGNYEHNAVVTTPFNAPSLRHMLTLDAKFWGVTWRLGYLGDIQQAKVNHLKQHFYTHALIIGVVKRFGVRNL